MGLPIRKNYDDRMFLWLPIEGRKNDNPLLDEENMTPPETVIQHADEACHM